MPIYDYVCLACGRRVEVIHGIDAPGPQACDACGGSMRKALSMPSIVFKGSGWAKMDARSAGDSGSQPSNEGTSGDGGAKEEAAPAGAGTKGGEAAGSDGGGSSPPKTETATPKAVPKEASKAAPKDVAKAADSSGG